MIALVIGGQHALPLLLNSSCGRFFFPAILLAVSIPWLLLLTKLGYLNYKYASYIFSSMIFPKDKTVSQFFS
jgi:hypothetical protein